jgi:hypothetical protein
MLSRKELLEVSAAWRELLPPADVEIHPAGPL